MEFDAIRFVDVSAAGRPARSLAGARRGAARVHPHTNGFWPPRARALRLPCLTAWLCAWSAPTCTHLQHFDAGLDVVVELNPWLKERGGRVKKGDLCDLVGAELLGSRRPAATPPGSAVDAPRLLTPLPAPVPPHPTHVSPATPSTSRARTASAGTTTATSASVSALPPPLTPAPPDTGPPHSLAHPPSRHPAHPTPPPRRQG